MSLSSAKHSLIQNLHTNQHFAGFSIAFLAGSVLSGSRYFPLYILPCSFGFFKAVQRRDVMWTVAQLLELRTCARKAASWKAQHASIKIVQTPTTPTPTSQSQLKPVAISICNLSINVRVATSPTPLLMRPIW